mgnify:CR=1 FL=1
MVYQGIGVAANRVINRVAGTIRIIKRGSMYYGVLDRSVLIFKDELLNKYVIARLYIGDTVLPFRTHVTIETAYMPPRLKITIPSALAPLAEQLHGRDVKVVIEYEDNEMSTSG